MNVQEAANPKLSLGTVYRNLKLLSEAGEIQRLSCGDGIDRFDATVAPHCHFLCDKCGSVQDVDMPPLDELEKKQLKNQMEKSMDTRYIFTDYVKNA